MQVHIAEAIQQSEKRLITLNQKQLRSSKDVADRPLAPTYSAAYARRKGYKKPDGFLSGEMYGEMFVDVNENNNTFSMFSFAPHTKYFAGRYGEVFGINKASNPQAQKTVVLNFNRIYKNKVLKK
jgi:hypothetical protein